MWLQALRDATSQVHTPEEEWRREEARRWLLEDGALWLWLLGLRVDEGEMREWAEAGWRLGRSVGKLIWSYEAEGERLRECP